MTKGRTCVTVKLLKPNKQEDRPFVMNKICSFVNYFIKYAKKYGVTNYPPANFFNLNFVTHH